MKNFFQDSDAVLDYRTNWARWVVSGDEIISAVTTVEPGLAVENQLFTATDTTVMLSVTNTAVVGTAYMATTHVVSDQGREDDYSFTVTIKEQ